jgi:hypothetical protein
MTIRDDDGFASATYDGVGVYTLTLAPGVGGRGYNVAIVPVGTYAASGLIAFNVVKNATTIVVTCGQEQPAGAASAAADAAFSIIVTDRFGLLPS